MSEAIAAEARALVRRAAGDVAGKTVAAQIREAARNLGYGADDWRSREAWYGRAGRWSAAAVDDLRKRFAAWREREAARVAASGAAGDSLALVERLGAIRAGLARITREVEEIIADFASAVDGVGR